MTAALVLDHKLRQWVERLSTKLMRSINNSKSISARWWRSQRSSQTKDQSKCDITHIISVVIKQMLALVQFSYEGKEVERLLTKPNKILHTWMPNKSQPFALEQGLERGWTLSVLVVVITVMSALIQISYRDKEVAVLQSKPMKRSNTSMAAKRWLSRSFLSKHQSKISKTSSSLGLVKSARVRC